MSIEEGIVIGVFSIAYVWNTILWMKEYRDEFPPNEQDPS